MRRDGDSVNGAALALASLMRRYPFRGKTFLWQYLEGKLTPARHTVRMPGGGRMVIDTTSYWQRRMISACFERRAVWLVSRLLGRGDTFIDGGANFGYFSCIAAGLVGPTGRVVAVEADARIIPELSQQAVLNPVIEVKHRALSRAAGRAEFFLPPDYGQGYDLALASLEPHEHWRKVFVDAITLDEVIASAAGTVRLLKLDVEDHEGPALEGARESLASGRLESVLVEVRRSTAALTELARYPFDAVLDVPSGFQPIDPAAFAARETDLVFLRGESWRRWAASSGWTRWV